MMLSFAAIQPSILEKTQQTYPKHSYYEVMSKCLSRNKDIVHVTRLSPALPTVSPPTYGNGHEIPSYLLTTTQGFVLSDSCDSEPTTVLFILSVLLT